MSESLDVEIGGYRVRILIDGTTGPVVVLCSGLGGRALHWTDTIANLADDHIVVRFDRPGTPVNHPLPRDYTVRGEADRIAAVLDAVPRSDQASHKATVVGQQKAIVVGHSVGGYYAEGFARRYPQRTGALLLLDSSIAPDHPWLALPLRAKLAAADVTALVLNKLHLLTPLARAGLTILQRRRPGGLDAQTRSEIRRAAAAPEFIPALLNEHVAYHQLAAELCRLRADYPLPPVRRTVVTAHTGLLTRRWRAEQIRLAKTLDAEHITIAPAGHFVMIEQPYRTAELIRAIGGSTRGGGPISRRGRNL